jgi:hypothetical protein
MSLTFQSRGHFIQPYLLRELRVTAVTLTTLSRNSTYNKRCFIYDLTNAHTLGPRHCHEVPLLVDEGLARFIDVERFTRQDGSDLPHSLYGVGGVAKALRDERSTTPRLDHTPQSRSGFRLYNTTVPTYSQTKSIRSRHWTLLMIALRHHDTRLFYVQWPHGQYQSPAQPTIPLFSTQRPSTTWEKLGLQVTN